MTHGQDTYAHTAVGVRGLDSSPRERPSVRLGLTFPCMDADPMDDVTIDSPQESFDGVADELGARLADGAWETWTEAELDRRTHAAFVQQFGACAPYRAFCRRRGVTPETIASWEEIPAVPATAFKYFDFDSSGDAPPGRADEDRAVFRTSGTTRGNELRGRHVVPRLDLYRASLLEPFRRALLPDTGMRTLPFVSLIPSPEEAPESSLSFMVGSAAERLATEEHWLVGADGAWRQEAVERLGARAVELRARAEPVLVLGTALSFLHLIDDVESERQPTTEPRDALRRSLSDALSALPEGSRAMETGGLKGAGREVSRAGLDREIERVTGIARGRIVSEYGMTELLSQLYEPVLTEGPETAGGHVAPPWLRVRALDPTTLGPVEEGRDGILAFFDLANLGSVCHVLTEDVGAIEDGRVRLRGRAAGAEPRGCSRAMDDLMSAAKADHG